MHAKASRSARDWKISVVDGPEGGAVFSVGVRQIKFYSPTLQYAVCFVVCQGTIGAQIGIRAIPNRAIREFQENLPDGLASAASQVSDGNSRWRIYSSFTANSMDGGWFGTSSVGADMAVVGGSGEKLVLRTNQHTPVAEYEGGSFGLTIGFSVNIMRGGIGYLTIPHWEWTGQR